MFVVVRRQLLPQKNCRTAELWPVPHLSCSRRLSAAVDGERAQNVSLRRVDVKRSRHDALRHAERLLKNVARKDTFEIALSRRVKRLPALLGLLNAAKAAGDEETVNRVAAELSHISGEANESFQPAQALKTMQGEWEGSTHQRFLDSKYAS